MQNYFNLKEILRTYRFIDYLVAFFILLCLLVAWIFIVAPRILLKH